MTTDDDTPTSVLVELPGYAPGFKDGYRMGMLRALERFREAMIEDGTDPGTAFLLAEKLARWIETHGG